MATQRINEHISDSDHEQVAGRVTRKIANWQSYRTPGGLLLPSDPRPEAQLSAPPDWLGAWDFSLASLAAPLQCFFRDSTDGANRVMWGMRRSDLPAAWVNWKLINPDNGSTDPIVDVAQRTVTWADVCTNVDLRLEVRAHSVRRVLVLKASGHRASFRFAMRLPNGASYTKQGGTLSLRRSGGAEYMRVSQTNGLDATEKSLRTALTEGDPITVGPVSLPTFWVTPLSADLSTAVYPVEVY